MKNDAFAIDKKISVAYYVICALAVVVILSTAIFSFWYADEVNSDGNILMEVSDGTETELKQINLSNFVPGSEYKQEIVIKNIANFDANCKINFLETEDSSLTPFLNVKIIKGDSTLFDDEMINLFGNSVNLGEVSGDNSAKYYVIYSMKETVESNGMNKSIVFDIEISCGI